MGVLVAAAVYNWTIPLQAKILSVLLIASGDLLLLVVIGLRRLLTRMPSGAKRFLKIAQEESYIEDDPDFW